jgi:tetratricopeptide (TPR) repeat protein
MTVCSQRLNLFPVFLLVALTSITAAQSNSATELSLGVQAYKQALYDDAIRHFENAAALDPTNIKAHHYLATAYAQQYIPGADLPENNQMAERAIAHYGTVIDLHPSINEKTLAVKGIAYLQLQMKKFEKAKESYYRAAELDPGNPELYYSIGVIDWTLTYGPRQEQRAKLDLKPDASLPAKNRQVCILLNGQNWNNISDGIENLNKALQLRPDYDDAMAYMNLMYRERADVQCDDPDARKSDLKTADEWVDRTMATKRMKAEKQTPSQNPQP